MRKKIDEIQGLSPVSRNLDVIYKDGQVKVIGLALVNYSDGFQGFELVGINEKGCVEFIKQDVIEVREVDQVEGARKSIPKKFYKEDNPYINREAEQWTGNQDL